MTTSYRADTLAPTETAEQYAERVSVEPFDPTRSQFTRTMAAGHLTRTGHALTGHYVPADIPGVVRLVRTCCDTGR